MKDRSLITPTQERPELILPDSNETVWGGVAVLLLIAALIAVAIYLARRHLQR